MREPLDSKGCVRKPSRPFRQSIVTLDMEGVLMPEIWIRRREDQIPELRRRVFS
jgi:hypothetical protein